MTFRLRLPKKPRTLSSYRLQIWSWLRLLLDLLTCSDHFLLTTFGSTSLSTGHGEPGKCTIVEYSKSFGAFNNLQLAQRPDL